MSVPTTPLTQKVAAELALRPAQTESVAELLAGGATVPFIARYRKEATGSLDEVQIAAVRDRLARLEELEKRRESILGSLGERELLTPELEAAVRGAATMVELEDHYLPFRPKRRTRAAAARERGLEPLAALLLTAAATGDAEFDPATAAEAFVDAEKDVPGVEEALAGARDIIAETATEDAEVRSRTRALYEREAVLRSRVAKGQEEPGAKFRDYFEWEEPAARAPSHRVLALFRGESEGVLRVVVDVPEEKVLALLEGRYLRSPGAGSGTASSAGATAAAEEVRVALRDAFKRLLGPSMENEARAELKARADEEAIRVFASNLAELLLAPPLGGKTVLAIDPGFRTGCKVTVLDPQGKLLHHDNVQPHQSKGARTQAGETVRGLVSRFGVEAVAVGNGTAGRETEAFVLDLGLGRDVVVVMVNESGASIYSASEVAREELPDHDITVRGSVSIGRRLQDPLAELVKIDPKSIGVGQYQHDVDQAALRRSLDDVVGTAVNRVGVEVNTASPSLLSHVSGLGPQLAANIVAFRDEEGPFRSRAQLKKVPRLGPKAFEQAAGFLRVREGAEPLDASAVHPESYPVVKAMAADLGVKVADLLRDAGLRARIDPARYVSNAVGLPTLRDILAELEKPGRDPRRAFEVFRFADGVESLEDLEEGMRLPGIVTNVTAFGAFVDVGVHQDGLVHISQLADRFVRDPSEVVAVQQPVMVTVLSVDLQRKRISLSMRGG
ncbi:MAG: RNA-binding transcriptional accessory protein [Actinobacteria bacterium]|nr:RNA-binding transcriptional accessory protein [Actinomycetota bacterium]